MGFIAVAARFYAALLRAFTDAKVAFDLQFSPFMANSSKESKIQALQDLSAAQVTTIVERSGLSREEVAKHLGCGTSQLFKYEKEGLPPRMNREVRAAILQLGLETEVLPANAATRATISKLSKAQTPSKANRSQNS